MSYSYYFTVALIIHYPAVGVGEHYNIAVVRTFLILDYLPKSSVNRT
jgi:hypothetical protein